MKKMYAYPHDLTEAFSDGKTLCSCGMSDRQIVISGLMNI